MQPLWQLLRWVWASPGTLVGLSLGLCGLLTGGQVQPVAGVLEFHGGLVTWFLRVIGRRAAAMTLGHVILGSSAGHLAGARAHELVHVRQYERWGPLFLPAYGLCALWQVLRGRHGYWDNPFEREAYDHCGDTALPATSSRPGLEGTPPAPDGAVRRNDDALRPRD